MLPIVKRRTLQIPHGLAAISAAVCLVLAFSTDLAERQTRILAEQAEAPAVQVIGSAEDALGESSGLADQRSERRARETVPPRPPARLIPWFPELRLGGG